MTVLYSPINIFCNAHRYSNEWVIIDMQDDFDEAMSRLGDCHQLTVNDLASEIHRIGSNFENCTNLLQQTQAEKERLIVDLSFCEQELKEEKVYRTQDRDSAELKADMLQKLKTAEISSLREDGQKRMQQLIEHHETNLQAEIGTLCTNDMYSLKIIYPTSQRQHEKVHLNFHSFYSIQFCFCSTGPGCCFRFRCVTRKNCL